VAILDDAKARRLVFNGAEGAHEAMHRAAAADEPHKLEMLGL